MRKLSGLRPYINESVVPPTPHPHPPNPARFQSILSETEPRTVLASHLGPESVSNPSACLPHVHALGSLPKPLLSSTFGRL